MADSRIGIILSPKKKRNKKRKEKREREKKREKEKERGIPFLPGEPRGVGGG